MYKTEMQFNDELVLSKMDELLQVEVGRHFTKQESIEKIINILGLREIKDDTDKLLAVRNSVVKCMSEKEDKEGLDLMNYIQSITSIIDAIFMY